MVDIKAMAAVAVSSTTTYYSEVFGTGDFTNWGMHFQWTGTPTGTITLWKSNKPNPSTADDTDWVQDTAFTFVSPAGGASKGGYEAGNSGFKAYRVKYVNASGSGALSLWVHGKSGV